MDINVQVEWNKEGGDDHGRMQLDTTRAMRENISILLHKMVESGHVSWDASHNIEVDVLTTFRFTKK